MSGGADGEGAYRGGGGFFLFVKTDVVPRLQRSGRRVNVSLPVACNVAKDRWQKLSDEEKARWSDKAKAYGRRTAEYQIEREERKERQRRLRQHATDDALQPTKGHKYKRNATIQNIEKERRGLTYYDEDSQAQFQEKRRTDRTELKANFEWNAPSISDDGTTNDGRLAWMRDQQFCILAAVEYVDLPPSTQPRQPQLPQYPPCELALVRLSMKDGVQDSRYWRIAHRLPNDIVKMHLQRATDNETNPDTGHGVPFANQNESNKKKYHLLVDYDAVLTELCSKTRKAKFIFVHSTDYNRVFGAIEYLKRHASKPYDSLREGKLVCVEDLAAQITEFAKYDVSEREIQNGSSLESWSAFDFDAKVLCRLHAAQGRRNCALATANKMAFFLFDYLCEKLDFECSLDRHVPLLSESHLDATTAPSVNSEQRSNVDTENAQSGSVGDEFGAVAAALDDDETFDLEEELAALMEAEAAAHDDEQTAQEHLAVTPLPIFDLNSIGASCPLSP